MFERIDSLAKQYQQLKKLSLSEIRIVSLALLLLPAIAFLLKIKGFRWTQSFLKQSIPERSQNTCPYPSQLLQAQNTSKLVSIAANHGIYRANCLKASLLTWWLLNRKKILVELKIGVNKDDEAFKAHAWVEFQGTTLGSSVENNKQFSVLINE